LAETKWSAGTQNIHRCLGLNCRGHLRVFMPKQRTAAWLGWGTVRAPTPAMLGGGAVGTETSSSLQMYNTVAGWEMNGNSAAKDLRRPRIAPLHPGGRA
jgi:hypothetical protein